MADIRPEDFGAVPVSRGAPRPEDFGAVRIAAPATGGERVEATKGGVNRGISMLAGLPVDTVENVINLGIAAYGALSPKEGTPLPQGGTAGAPPNPIQGSFGGSDSVARGLERLGINTQNPRPDDAASRMLHTGGTIAGGSLVPGVGVRNTLAAATGGALAGEALGPGYVGVGAMAPAAGMQAAQAAKAAIANPATVQRNIDTFKTAGTAPDVGQATESNFFRGLTNVVARFPGGEGVISKFRELEQKALGDTAKTGVSAEAGGRAIKEGITGEGGFLDRTKATWLNLDNQLAAKVGNSSASPQKTVSALDSLTTPTPGAEKTTGALVNPKIAEIRTNLAADLKANNGVMPFEALRALRGKVGSMLDDSLVSGIPNGELKKLYGALSQDMQEAANRAGAGAEFARQQNYYRARMDRIENTLDSVLGDKKTFEQIFKGTAPTDVEQVNRIRRVMRSLSDDQREVVSDAIVNRMGRATPGKQDATGEKFSSETFLSNWSRIGDSAKAQLFPDATMRAKVDAISKVSADIRDSNKVFGNPSGTTQGIISSSIYFAPVASLTTGNLAPVVVAGGMVAGANIGAKMLTSPEVVNWLAKSAKATTTEQTTAQLARLAVIFNESKDPKLKQELGDYINSVQQQTKKQ